MIEETPTPETRADSPARLEHLVMWIVDKWDLFVYRMSYRSLPGMCVRNPAFALILKRSLGEWLDQNPMNHNVEDSANSFFEAVRDCKDGDPGSF